MKDKFKALITIFPIFIASYFVPMMILNSQTKNEAYYQDISANLLKGKKEVIMSDKTRVDILTEKIAIEVDWAPKWAEGIGQALYYSAQTGLEAGLILIVKDFEKEQKYVDRVQRLMRIKSIRIFLYVFDVKKKELRRIQ